MITVTKEFTWDSAHRLVKGYPGKCAHNHGHTYRAEITLVSPARTLNEFGFVEDFDKFKSVKKWVDDHWDHGTLISDEDEKLKKWLVDNNQKYFIFEGNPTVENICLQLLFAAEDILNTNRVFVQRVKVYETPTSCAEVIK